MAKTLVLNRNKQSLGFPGIQFILFLFLFFSFRKFRTLLMPRYETRRDRLTFLVERLVTVLCPEENVKYKKIRSLEEMGTLTTADFNKLV